MYSFIANKVKWVEQPAIFTSSGKYTYGNPNQTMEHILSECRYRIVILAPMKTYRNSTKLPDTGSRCGMIIHVSDDDSTIIKIKTNHKSLLPQNSS